MQKLYRNRNVDAYLFTRKMWIRGLKILQKPLCIFIPSSTDIPWSTMDMDFMNLNQAAHGDSEFGFMVSRLRKTEK
jgi:L-arabinose isomerase